MPSLALENSHRQEGRNLRLEEHNRQKVGHSLLREERKQQQEEEHTHLLVLHRRSRFPTISWLSGIHLEGALRRQAYWLLQPQLPLRHRKCHRTLPHQDSNVHLHN